MPDTAAQSDTNTTLATNRRPRIALFGGYGIGNFGNDASLEAILSFLRAERPDAELSSICTNPDVVTARYGLPAVPTAKRPTSKLGAVIDKLLLRQPSLWASWAHSLGVLGRYDLILVAGTGVFDDFRDTPFGWPSRLLRWSLGAHLRGTPLSYVCVGAGPIESGVSRQLMKWAAQLGRHRSYRDEDSRDFMVRLGVDDAASAVLPDLAFLLPRKPEAARADGPLIVGVGVMTYRGWRDSEAVYRAYIDSHVRLIRWIEAQGHIVKVVIGQTPADLTAVRDVEAQIGRPLLGPQGEKMASFHDAMAAISETDLVVASRYHVQIAALKMRRPLISLGYAPKNDALMEQAGLSAFVHHVETFDFDTVTRQIEDMAANRTHYASVVDTHVSAMEARLIEALRSLDVLRRPA